MSKEQLSDAAFIQSITENSVILNYCSKEGNHPPISFKEIYMGIKDSNDPDMELFRAFYERNADQDFYLQDISSFGEGKGLSMLITNKKSNDVFVAFDGSDNREWVDNGLGLCNEATPQQVAAANRFDDYVKAFHLTENDNIVVTGHSKGGNKAMFVTMEASNARLIDSCVALDGQGFSPEAIDRWKKNLGDKYADAVNKITLVKGKRDFVNQLGITIAGHEYTIGYDNWCGIKKSGSNPIYSWHDHRWLFKRDKNGELILNTSASPGIQDPLMKCFMMEYMQLSREDRERSAPKLMHIIELAKTGELDSYDKKKLLAEIDDVLVILAETENGENLLYLVSRIVEALLIPVVGVVPPIPIELYFLDVKRRAKENKKNQSAKGNSGNSGQSGSNPQGGTTIINPKSQIQNPNQVRKGPAGQGGSTRTIVLNKEAFETLYSRFENAFSYAIEGAQYAERAESRNHDANVCGPLMKIVIEKADNIKEMINRIIESFTSTDTELKTDAESIVGKEIYNAIYRGGQVIVDGNGSYSINYAPRLQGYEGIPQYSNECTNISCAMMLQRWMIAHDPNYDNKYGYRQSGKVDIHPYVEPWRNTTSVNLPDGHSFETKMHYDPLSNIQMAELLSTRPEGVVVYAPYKDGKHAIVVTRCEMREDGSFQFYAIDPSNVRYSNQKTEIPLEQTHLYRNGYRSSEALFASSTYQYVVQGTYPTE